MDEPPWSCVQGPGMMEKGRDKGGGRKEGGVAGGMCGRSKVGQGAERDLHTVNLGPVGELQSVPVTLT